MTKLKGKRKHVNIVEIFLGKNFIMEGFGQPVNSTETRVLLVVRT